MSAPMIGKILTFSKLSYIHKILRGSRFKWTNRRQEHMGSQTNSLDVVNRADEKQKITGDTPDKMPFVPFREMIQGRYLQADRSILIQLHKMDDIRGLLTWVQRKYKAKINKGFLYPDYNGKNLILLELANGKYLHLTDCSRVMNKCDFMRVDKKDEAVLERLEEYKPDGFQLDKLNQCDNISDQMICLHREMKMSEAMVRLHFFVGTLIVRFIRRSFKDVQAMFFGSSASGLAMDGKSDLDLVVLEDSLQDRSDLLKQLYRQFKYSKDAKKRVFRQFKYFKDARNLFNGVVHIPHARVPIIKILQNETNMPCDICCNNLNGVMMAELLHWLNAYEPLLFPLIMTLKMWAKEHCLTSHGAGRHFSNHMLTMLVIAYLQQTKLLPPLNKLYAKRDDSTKKTGPLSTWRDVELKKMTFNVNNVFVNNDIGDLLKGFFQFYSKFPFEDHVIDIQLGKVFNRSHKDEIFLLDPHDKGHNVCKNVRHLQSKRFQVLCKHSGKLLEMYHQKTSNGTPWGLTCVLTSQIFKQKTQGKLFGLDIDFSDNGRIDEITVEVGEDEEMNMEVVDTVKESEKIRTGPENTN